MSFIPSPVHQSRAEERYNEKGVDGWRRTIHWEGVCGSVDCQRCFFMVYEGSRYDEGFLVFYLFSNVLVQPHFLVYMISIDFVFRILMLLRDGFLDSGEWRQKPGLEVISTVWEEEVDGTTVECSK